jgi:hypothetical protein
MRRRTARTRECRNLPCVAPAVRCTCRALHLPCVAPAVRCTCRALHCCAEHSKTEQVDDMLPHTPQSPCNTLPATLLCPCPPDALCLLPPHRPLGAPPAAAATSSPPPRAPAAQLLARARSCPSPPPLLPLLVHGSCAAAAEAAADAARVDAATQALLLPQFVLPRQFAQLPQLDGRPPAAPVPALPAPSLAAGDRSWLLRPSLLPDRAPSPLPQPPPTLVAHAVAEGPPGMQQCPPASMLRQGAQGGGGKAGLLYPAPPAAAAVAVAGAAHAAEPVGFVPLGACGAPGPGGAVGPMGAPWAPEGAPEQRLWGTAAATDTQALDSEAWEPRSAAGGGWEDWEVDAAIHGGCRAAESAAADQQGTPAAQQLHTTAVLPGYPVLDVPALPPLPAALAGAGGGAGGLLGAAGSLGSFQAAFCWQQWGS